MDPILVFGIEVLLSLGVSATILVRLQALLREIGNEVCESGNRGATEFWLAYTQLMMLIAPILLVAWFSRAGQHSLPIDQIKSSLGLILVGQFAALVLVGRAVWKSIVREPKAKPAAA